MNFTKKQKAWIMLIALVLSSGCGSFCAAMAGGADNTYCVIAGLAASGGAVFGALSTAPKDVEN
jgi:uncharacterized protein YceK